jgi:hypothetical protein
MLRGTRHRRLWVAFAQLLQLMPEHGDFFLILLLERHVSLLHGVHFLSNKLHLADLCSDLLVEVLSLSQLGSELSPNLLEKLVKSASIGRGNTTHAVPGVHMSRHVEGLSNVGERRRVDY